ncbi:MAG TPA: nucleotide sugar dehydrogenase [Terriglobales bacterium]|nr:nucleotide sugar dehydrogenase [Terriglobales bacterium]
MTHSSLLEKIQRNQAEIGIIGLGYVGLPLALVFCQAGFHVTGFDVDETKVKLLGQGKSYIRHIGESAVADSCRTGRLSATTDFARLAKMDAILICVPTPLDHKRQPDLSYVENTARMIAANLRPGQLVVLESTTYPGTTDEVLVPILESSGVLCRAVVRPQSAAAGGGEARSASSGDARAFVAFSPEREDPGNQRFTTRLIPKVIGGIDSESGVLAAALYAAAFVEVVPVSSARAAEMTKILENTYRCVNIALVNELNQLCRRMSIDICEVIDAAATKPFGFQPFYPGPGMGGHCIPIDPFYLSWKARDYDFTTRFIELAGEINVETPYRVVEAITAALNQTGAAVKQARILVLGVAYKKDIDDLRESPALKVIDLLLQRGAHVVYHDPHCPHVPPTRHYSFSMDSISFEPIHARDYTCVVIMTDHAAFDYPAIAEHARLMVDTRNATRGIDKACIVRF